MTQVGLYLLKAGTLTIKNIGTAGGESSAYATHPAGYYKGANSNEYFYCDNEAIQTCKYLETIPEGCASANVGKLVKNGNKVGLCLANYEKENGEAEPYTPILEFISTTVTEQTTPNLSDVIKDTYFVRHSKKQDNDVRVFNFDKTANYYALKRLDYYSIVFNNQYSKLYNNIIMKFFFLSYIIFFN